MAKHSDYGHTMVLTVGVQLCSPMNGLSVLDKSVYEGSLAPNQAYTHPMGQWIDQETEPQFSGDSTVPRSTGHPRGHQAEAFPGHIWSGLTASLSLGCLNGG